MTILRTKKSLTFPKLLDILLTILGYSLTTLSSTHSAALGNLTKGEQPLPLHKWTMIGDIMQYGRSHTVNTNLFFHLVQKVINIWCGQVGLLRKNKRERSAGGKSRTVRGRTLLSYISLISVSFVYVDSNRIISYYGQPRIAFGHSGRFHRTD